MNNERRAPGLLASVTLLLVAAAASGCWMMADCWSDMEVTVNVAESIPFTADQALLVMMVQKIEDDDVTGTNAQGIPQGSEPHDPEFSFGMREGIRTYQGSSTDGLAPYDTWVYAFIDTNGNGALDSQEPFGVAPNNPVKLEETSDGCAPYAGTLAIDALYP